jgi:hypothetical protein
MAGSVHKVIFVAILLSSLLPFFSCGNTVIQDAGFDDAPGDAGIPADAGTDGGVVTDSSPWWGDSSFQDAEADATGSDVFVPSDSGFDGGLDGSTAMDAGGDAGGDAGADGGVFIDGGTCPPPEESDYKCDMLKPETCPGGWCIAGWCLGPNKDPRRWDECGIKGCGLCETAGSCPADCAMEPPRTGSKEYVNDTTITVWVHGFSNVSEKERETMVFGRDRGCGGLLTEMAKFGVVRPCSEHVPKAPNQLTRVEYYGKVPPDWMSQADADEIAKYPYEGTDGLHRYALIVAKYIKYKLQVSGATHANIVCHSMGCYISRYMIENNVENLAASNKIVRWHTSAGVLAGARLARLYDNPDVQKVAGLIGLSQYDFLIMNPDFAQDNAAMWDHKLWEGNNPMFGGIIMHHTGATDPRIAQAINIKLLDLDNPGDEPNDGIMYTLDEFFHDRKGGGAFKLPSGEVIASGHNYVYVDHMTVPESEPSVVAATATIFHKRKVRLTLNDVQLIKDRESHALFDGENGTAPAEITYDVEVRYNPYIKNTYGRDVLVHEASVEHRSAELYTQEEGTTLNPHMVIFEGPVFDQMTELRLDIKLLEADWYPRFNVKEWAFDIHQELASYHGQVPLVDKSVISFESEYLKAKIEMRVFEQY